MTMIVADKKYLVVGLGLTGVSCVRFLQQKGKYVEVIDSRIEPPGLPDIRNEFPDLTVHLGFSDDVLLSADVLVMSPGVALSDPAIRKAVDAGAVVTSDIELFLSEYRGKVIAVTGSNAKSTVTAWLGEALKLGGQHVLVAGNIGRPVLDCLDESYDIAVLELSSFQLELISKLSADVATILNISEDHMDRYNSLAHYIQAKQRIYFGVRHVVYNRDDALTQPLVPDSVPRTSFGMSTPDLKTYGLTEADSETWLNHGLVPVMSADDVALPGRHNLVNALAVLALADAVGNPREATVSALMNFKGLPFRCEAIAERNGIRFINDSKATNVGSVIAALTGLVSDQGPNIHLLAGGQAKGQDLSPLVPVLQDTCKSVSVFGEDRGSLQQCFTAAQVNSTLEEAFYHAVRNAESGDIILLSPACASFDQFQSFEHRGRVFNELVGALS